MSSDPNIRLCEILDFGLCGQPPGVLEIIGNIFPILSCNGIPDVRNLGKANLEILFSKYFSDYILLQTVD